MTYTYATFTHNDNQPIVATALYTVIATFTYFDFSVTYSYYFGIKKNFESAALPKVKQVDILISKNQALQILLLP